MTILGWFKRLFRRREDPYIDQYARDIAFLEAGKCPNCESTDFFLGPHGGTLQNIMCANCGIEYNYCDMAPIMSHRNNDQFDPSRNWAYQLSDDWKPRMLRDAG